MKRFFSHFSIFFLSLISYFLFPVYVFADACSQYQMINGQKTCVSVNTALGPISTSPGGLVGSIMAILLSLAGGVAILLIIAAGYQLVTSQGNPEKVKAARERLTSAIVGLLFIIFSVALLQIIGISILHIPGLS